MALLPLIINYHKRTYNTFPSVLTRQFTDCDYDQFTDWNFNGFTRQMESEKLITNFVRCVGVILMPGFFLCGFLIRSKNLHKLEVKF